MASTRPAVLESSLDAPGALLTSMRKRFLSCATAGFLNLAGSQVLRLAGNLILTRMLFPEAFGLMALVNVFMMGLAMFSDLGLGPGIIQRKEKPTELFLQTAWTIQIIRAALLWGLAILIAWPLAAFYEKPELVPVICVVGLTQFIAGFKSTSLHMCARELKHGAITAVELSTSMIGIVASVLIAWLHPSVWALVWGGMISAVWAVAATFLLPHQVPVRFRLDRESFRELFHFGKWIFLGTAFTFLASEGDRLMLGKFLDLTQLGIYTVAFFFAQSVCSLIRGIANRALFPVLSRMNDATAEEQRGEYVHYRRLFLGLALVPVCFFALCGEWMISFLYDERYFSAGDMLRVLSFGAAAATLSGLTPPVLLARGHARSRMFLSLWEAILLVVCMAAGGAVLGMYGFVFGFVAAQVLGCVPAILALRRQGVATPGLDLIYFGVLALLGLITFTLNPIQF